MRDEEYRKACDLFLNRVFTALKEFSEALGVPEMMQDEETKKDFAYMTMLLAESIRRREDGGNGGGTGQA